MKDFIGNEYIVGNYVATCTLANKHCDKDCVLYRILDINENKKCLKLIRSRISSWNLKTPIQGKMYHTFTTQYPQRYICVNPTQEFKDLFENAIKHQLTDADRVKHKMWLVGW